MPRTLLKDFGGEWVGGGGGLESQFSVHLWSKALAYVGTKLNKISKYCCQDNQPKLRLMPMNKTWWPYNHGKIITILYGLTLSSAQFEEEKSGWKIKLQIQLSQKRCPIPKNSSNHWTTLPRWSRLLHPKSTQSQQNTCKPLWQHWRDQHRCNKRWGKRRTTWDSWGLQRCL